MKDLVKDGPVNIWQDEDDGYITVAFRGITIGFDNEDWASFTLAVAQAAALNETPIYQYMKARAAHEGVAFALEDSFFRDSFNKGIRLFFGVQVHDDGTLCNDSLDPEFFAQYRCDEVPPPEMAAIAGQVQH